AHAGHQRLADARRPQPAADPAAPVADHAGRMRRHLGGRGPDDRDARRAGTGAARRGARRLRADRARVPAPPAAAKHERWLGPLAGGLTGLVTAATGVFVIPAVPYLQAIGLEKDDLVQALGLSFTVSTL